MFKILKYFLLALPALLGALILTLAKTMPFMAENVFAASFFPVVSGALTWFSGLFPFSLTEFGLYALVLILLGDVVRLIVLKLRPFRFLRRVLFVCSVAFLLYVIMHGVNFYRPTVQEFMKLDDPSDSVEELYNACVEEAKAASALRATLSEDENGRFGNAERHRQRIQKRNSEVADFSEKRSVKGKRSAYLPALVVHGHYGNVFSDAWGSKCEHKRFAVRPAVYRST